MLAAEAAPAPALQTAEVRTLAATSQVLEVGVASGTHGWLRVRAEMASGGEVSASVMASSAEAVKALHHELPGLQEYLSREQVGVASVAVSATSASTQDAGSGVAADGGSQPRGGDGSTQQQRTMLMANEAEAWNGIEAGPAFGLAAAPSLYGQSIGGGGWVNVRV